LTSEDGNAAYLGEKCLIVRHLEPANDFVGWKFNIKIIKVLCRRVA
jgi:hypothetical protein